MLIQRNIAIFIGLIIFLVILVSYFFVKNRKQKAVIGIVAALFFIGLWAYFFLSSVQTGVWPELDLYSDIGLVIGGSAVAAVYGIWEAVHVLRENK